MQPLQKIYRLLLIIIISGLACNILPFLASIIAMLIFSFLFTTIFLPSVDRFEKFLKSRILSVLLILSSSSLLSISFLGLFFSNVSSHIKLFTKRIDNDDFVMNLSGLSNKIREYLPDFISKLIPKVTIL